jgi:hypothetical protein
MSQENVELVQRSWEAEIRDFDFPDADVGRGHEGFLAWLRRWNEAWESWSVDGLSPCSA